VPYVYDVCVAEIQGIDVLVGLDFLIDVGAHIDLAKLQVTLGNQKVPIRTHRLEPTITAHTMEESRIPARTAAHVVCSAPDWPDGQEALLEAVVSWVDGVEVVPSLVVAREGRILIYVINRSTTDFCIPKKEVVGVLTSLATVHAIAPTSCAPPCRGDQSGTGIGQGTVVKEQFRDTLRRR
jgi:hypothetical protein